MPIASSLPTNSIITVFGGTGFVGRHVVQSLAARGYVVRVVTRHKNNVLHLKTAGAVGQVVPITARPWNEAECARAIDGVSAVINLVGILYESGQQTFDRAHHIIPETIARICAQKNIRHLVHLSAIGAKEGSDSQYAHTKALGEVAIRNHCKDAVILRPSIIFGPDDNFFNRFARMALWSPALPLIGGGKTQFQPIYVGDVVRAVMASLDNPAALGRTFELGGPGIYTFGELLRFVMRETGRERLLVNLPFGMANVIARVMEILPNPMLTRDQVTLLKYDNVVGGRADGAADLGITPTAMEAIVPAYLAAYRQGGKFGILANEN